MKKLFLSLIFLMVFESISAEDLRNQLAIDIPGVMTKVTDWRHHFHEFAYLPLSKSCFPPRVASAFSQNEARCDAKK